MAFKPSSQHELVSVGVDRQILIWDLRVAPKSVDELAVYDPVHKINNVHNDDINTVAWSGLNEHLLATGSNDKKVCLLDIRKLS